MNQRRAKMIRREVYWDMARTTVEYERNTKTREIRAKGLRRKYQEEKKQYVRHPGSGNPR